MGTYLVLYRGQTSAREQMANTTPEMAKAGMDAWMTWAATAGESITDLGAPLAEVSRLGAAAAAAGGDQVTGYSFLQADSADDVTALLALHPHLHMPDGRIEVLEVLAMPGS